MIAEEIDKMITMQQMSKNGFMFMAIPDKKEPYFMASIKLIDLQKYFILITDKIKEIESDNK